MTAAAECRNALTGLVLPGDRRGLAKIVLVALAVLAVAGACASLTIGPVTLKLSDCIAVIAAEFGAIPPLGGPDAARVILFDIRARAHPSWGSSRRSARRRRRRHAGLFRNPLADPGLVGISASASLAAVATIVLGPASLPMLWAAPAFSPCRWRPSSARWPEPSCSTGSRHAADTPRPRPCCWRHRHRRAGPGGDRHPHLHERRPAIARP